MIDIAYAQTAAAGGGPANLFGNPLLLMAVIFAIFYFLLIRPQQKQQKAHQEMLNNLKKGDRVRTNGGIFGRITSLDENKVTLEIADKVRIKILRSGIGDLDQPTDAAKEDKKDKK